MPNTTFNITEKSNNDGKEKRQSEELDLSINTTDTLIDCYGSVDVMFYGSNKEEIKLNKLLFIDKLILTLQEYKEKTVNGN